MTRPASLLALALAALCSRSATGADLKLPSSALERNGLVPAVFHFEHGHTGQGQLRIRWTDSLGRVVEDETKAVALEDEMEIVFNLDLSRAVAMKNTVRANLVLEEVTPKGMVHVEEEGAADFIAKPADAPWNDYAIIMYQRYPSAIQPKLELLGINGGQYPAHEAALPEYLIDNNMRWYSENLANDYLAEYHRWRSDRGYDWSLDEAKKLYEQNPASIEAFKRHPSFWDAEWRSRIHDRIVEVVRRNAPYRPFFYSLSDETGIASIGSQWDFDFSDQSLVPMRRWLRTLYGTLDALNTEWGTSFSSWNLVMPSTTNEAMQRKGENFAAWADFKDWMDLSYADAIAMGIAAVREVDPTAPVGIVGAQKPGWGGYDYSRLTKIVSAMEPYDIGGSVKLAHSLNPSLPLLSTGFAGGKWEKHRVWFELLQGHRGMILWDESQRYIAPDGSKGEAGKEAESYYNEIRDGMGALIINSVGHDDGIVVHYSQPSMRTEWMLERRPDGDAWMKRDASYERRQNTFMQLRESWGHAIEDQGLQYNFVSYKQVEEGELLRHGYHMLLLPHSSSLSLEEASRIRDFVQAGGVVVADGMPGTFDEHSRRLPASSLAALFGGEHTGPLTIRPYGKGKAIFVNISVLDYLKERITGKEFATYKVMQDLFKMAGIQPEIATTDAKGDPLVGLDVHVFANGAVRLLSLQSNPQADVDELGPPDFHSNQRFEKPIAVRVHLPAPMFVYDIRAKKALGRLNEASITVDPYEPTILALSAEPQPQLQVSAPDEAVTGSLVSIGLGVAGSMAAQHVFHVDVLDPSKERMLQYSGNVIGEGGAAVKELPLAKNDPAGPWTIKVEDMLTGAVVTRVLNVR